MLSLLCAAVYGSIKYILYDSDLILRQMFSLVFRLVAINVVSQYDGCLFHEFLFKKYYMHMFACRLFKQFSSCMISARFSIFRTNF